MPDRRVVIIQEHLPHYRVELYQELSTRLSEAGVRMDLVFDPNTSDNLIAGRLDWAHPVPIRWLGPVGWQPVFSIINDCDLVVLQQEMKYISNLVAQFLLRIIKVKVAYWGHGKNFQSRNRYSIAEMIKPFVSLHCDWWFPYNNRSKEIVLQFGYPAERMTVVMNSIDTRGLRTLRARLTSSEIDRTRRALGIVSENVGIYTGAMYADKRMPFLLGVCKAVRNNVPDFEMIFVGGGCDAPLVEAAARENSWIHFVGFKNNEEKVPYWALAKVFLMPGAVGLVILDSFALEVPMVTTAVTTHGPEIDYLEDGVNGIMVKDPESIQAFAGQVIRLLNDEPSRQALVAGCRASAPRYTVERSATLFADGVLKALSAPRYQGPKLFMHA